MTETLREYKRQAAAHAIKLVEPGMTLGLGTGSTANEFISLLAGRMKRENLDLRCVATSEATRLFAEKCGIPIVDFNSIANLDLTVDGADEIDPELNMIKGGGGALLREKIVAMASDTVCIVADSSKSVRQLGAFALPVEIVNFGFAATLTMIGAAAEEAGYTGDILLRRNLDGQPFTTDNGHMIVDCAFGAISDVEMLADVLDIIPGIVEHGLFIGVADRVILAGPDGVTVLDADGSKMS